jgi:hypothetical protein
VQKDEAIPVWLKGLDFPMQLTKQVFTNKDGSTGELYLVTNDLELTVQAISTTYPLLYFGRLRNELALVFNVILLSSFLFDQTLETQIGVGFYLLLQLVFYSESRERPRLGGFATLLTPQKNRFSNTYRFP